MNREIVPDLDENIAYIEKRFEGCDAPALDGR